MTDIPLLTSPRPLLAILNRGEIVARIARSAKKVGFKILTIYSPEDHDSPHVNFGDCTVNLQRFFEQNRHVIQSNSQQDNKESAKQLSDIELYLSEGLLIELCIFYGVNYVHPGYGFLSESATFAAGLTDVGIKWVGPTSNTMETIGLKIELEPLLRFWLFLVYKASPYGKRLMNNYLKLPNTSKHLSLSKQHQAAVAEVCVK